jgi:uncharacterized RmlC-like cupin family protein
MAWWNALAAVALLTVGTLAAPLPAGASSEDEHAAIDWSLGWDGLRYRAAADTGQVTGGRSDRAIAEAPPGDGLVSGTATSQSSLYVISGRGVMKFADESRALAAGDLLQIPEGLRHSFEQVGDTPLVVLMNATPGRGGSSGAAAK